HTGKFIPERFLKPVEKNSFMPFGGGVRLYPGKHVAIASLKALMVLLFGKYEVELVNPNQLLKIGYKLGNACQEMKVYLTPKVKFDLLSLTISIFVIYTKSEYMY
ncbi:13206_t:CDS:1, partial [Ambispora gerdemannii]